MSPIPELLSSTPLLPYASTVLLTSMHQRTSSSSFTTNDASAMNVVASPNSASAPTSSSSPRPSCFRAQEGLNLYVSQVPAAFNSTKLREAFSRFGPIHSVKIMYDNATNESRCFGFVLFERAADGERAMCEMNGVSLEEGSGRLHVRVARPSALPNPLREGADAVPLTSASKETSSNHNVSSLQVAPRSRIERRTDASSVDFAPRGGASGTLQVLPTSLSGQPSLHRQLYVPGDAVMVPTGPHATPFETFSQHMATPFSPSVMLQQHNHYNFLHAFSALPVLGTQRSFQHQQPTVWVAGGSFPSGTANSAAMYAPQMQMSPVVFPGTPVYASPQPPLHGSYDAAHRDMGTLTIAVPASSFLGQQPALPQSTALHYWAPSQRADSLL